MINKVKSVSLLLALIVVFSCFLPVNANTEEKGYINNASLVPKYVTDDKVKLISANNGAIKSPEWVKSLIIQEINIQNVSPNGRFSGMTYVLDHLQEMGINGIWLDPIYGGLHYLNNGPETVDSYLTGTSDYEEGWQVVADFVKEAHKRNIRVFLDIVTWGANPNSAIVKNHPEWFDKYNESYKGPQYDWTNPELVDWFANELIDIVHKTDIDGYRADCGIDYGCRELYVKVRNELYNEGNYIIIMGETVRDDTKDIFDFNEHSRDYDLKTEGQSYIDGTVNIVAACKTGYGIDTLLKQGNSTAGQDTFYTSLVSCHDSQQYTSTDSYVNIVYSSILSPFIPLWYCGEEWNNTYTSTGWLWATGVYWSEIEKNRDYYENIKAYIRIRRMYPEIFEDFPLNHRDVNICEVETDHTNAVLHSYARFDGKKGILVVPNQGEMSSSYKITIPYSDMKLDKSKTYTVINLLSGKIVATGEGNRLVGISANIDNKNVAVYLVREAEKGEEVTISQNQSVVSDKTTATSSETFIDISSQTVISTDENAIQNDSSQSGDEPLKKTIIKKVPGEVTYEEYYLPEILIGVGSLLLIGGGITAFLIIKKKKKA